MSALLTIRDGQGYATGLTPEAIEAVRLATSYRPDGYQYSKAYKRGRSDGRVRLFKHSKFPAGLIGRVRSALDEEGVEYDVEVESTIGAKVDLPSGLRLVGIEDRGYQDDAVEAALLNPRGIIRAPTGSGKTAMLARIVIERRKHAVIVVPTIDLLHQCISFLEAHLMDDTDDGDPTGGDGWGRFKIGQLGDGIVDPRAITVATVRTMAKAVDVAYTKYEYAEYDDADSTKVDPGQLRGWIEGIGTVIVDEAHILGADMVYEIVNKIPAPNKMGMSASPWRDDGADLKIEAATGPVIFAIPTKELVDAGYLVPPVIQVVSTRGWWTPAAWGTVCSGCGRQKPKKPGPPVKRCPSCGSTTWTSEFTQAYREEIVENAVRNARIAAMVESLHGATLVLVKQVKHGRLLNDMLPQATFLSGKDSGAERQRVFDDVRSGKTRVIIATTIADMGLDIPALTNLVLAGGGKSSTRHLQRIGRVARPYEGKESALVIDFDDGHVHKWFRAHAEARRKIEKAEWAESALWI